MTGSKPAVTSGGPSALAAVGELPGEVPIGHVRVRGYWKSVWVRLSRDKVSVGCAVVLLLVTLSAIFAPVLSPHDPYAGNVLKRLSPIGSPGYVLGADELGRDMLSRLLYGGRVSLFVGIFPVLCALIIGGTAGIAAGFIGGQTNMVIMRLMDVFYAFPSVLLAIAISGALGGGFANVILSLTLILIPPITRVAESVTTQIRAYDFVEAARASGAETATIIRVHVLSNVLGPIFIYTTSLISFSIIVASGLSFLGLGVTPPTADWGLMLSTLRQAIWVNPYVAALPGVMIFVTSLCFNLLSDGLRSAMDMRI